MGASERRVMQGVMRAGSGQFKRQTLVADADLARLAVQGFGSQAHFDQLKEAGHWDPETPKHRHKEKQSFQAIKFRKIGTEANKTQVLNAAVSVYRLLYAPKGTINGLNEADWSVSRTWNLMISFIFTMLGIVLAVWQNEILWYNKSEVSALSFWLKVLTLATTCAAVFFLRGYYRGCIAQERLRGLPLHNGSVSSQNLKSCGLFTQFVLDMVFLLPQPIPFITFDVEVQNDAFEATSVYHIDVLLTVVMFLRIRFFPRFYGECVSGVSNATSRAYGNVTRLVIGENFIFKYLITSSYAMVAMLWFAQICFFSYCLMIFERPMQFIHIAHPELHQFANCLWCTVITMTIVGYGDMYPVTRLGRITMMIASISALIMVAISTNIINVMLTQSRAESKVVEVMNMLDARDDVKIKAAELIQAAWRAYKAPVVERTRRGRKVVQNETFMLRVWDFAHSSRMCCIRKYDTSADSESMLGSCMGSIDRNIRVLEVAETELDKALKSLQAVAG